MKITLLTLILVCSSATASSTEFSKLIVDQPISDNEIVMGEHKFVLPEGEWLVASKIEQRVGIQSGTSGTPTQLIITAARIEGESVKAIFMLRTPAHTFPSTNRWSDDPCKGLATALVKDTMKQTIFMPECFAILQHDAMSFKAGNQRGAAGLGSVLKRLQSQLPEQLLRVFYAKYYGGDFVQANLYLPSDAQTLPAAEAWGRNVAVSIQKMVTRESRSAVIPKLP